MPLVLRLPNQITRFTPGPNIFWYICSIFTIISKRALSQLSMSHQNFSLLIFLQSLCPANNTCAYAIKLWAGRQLQLLTMRECEVMRDHHLNVSQLPFPSSQYCLEPYCTLYSTCNHLHLSFVYFI